MICSRRDVGGPLFGEPGTGRAYPVGYRSLTARGVRGDRRRTGRPLRPPVASPHTVPTLPGNCLARPAESEHARGMSGLQLDDDARTRLIGRLEEFAASGVSGTVLLAEA